MFSNQAKWELEQHYRDPDRKKGYSSAETGHTCSVSAYHLLGPFCTSEYSSNGSDIITQNLERYIKSTKACNAETEWFLKEIRCKIFCLHEYNLKVAEADYQKKYPLTPYLRKLLIQYVILECRHFQKSSRFPVPSSEVQVQKRILRLLFIVFGDYFRGLQVEPLKLSTECAKEVVRLFVELKSQSDIKSPLLDKTAEKLLQRIGKLEHFQYLQGKPLPCPIDPLLASPDFLNIRRRLIKELWTERLDLHQQLDDDGNDDEDEEVLNCSSLVPTIQLEDDNSHRIFWDTEVDTHVRWWKSQNFTSSDGMSFIETIPLDSSDEESTSGHSHCDIVNTIDVNISNNDLISSRQASPYVVAFNVKDGDIGKSVILSNKKKTSSQFNAGDVKEKKTTVFPKKPSLGNSRTLSEHSDPSGKDESRETDEDSKLQTTKSRLIQKTSNLHYTINISNEIFGFDKFLNSRDSEYSYRKSTNDYKETPILHSKHHNAPYKKKASTAREKRDSLQSATFFDDLISKLNKPNIKLKRAKLKSCNFRELECFGGKLGVKTKISTEVSKNKSRKPTADNKTVLIEISSDEEEVTKTSENHVKSETSRGATIAEKVALKKVPENKHVAETISPEIKAVECHRAASSKFSPDNSEVIEANKSITSPCDTSTVSESENSKNVAEVVILHSPKSNIETFESSKSQISDKDAENLQNISHIISEVTVVENTELPETLKSTEKVQNITIQEHNDQELIEPSLPTENISSKLPSVEGAQRSENVNEESDVSPLKISDGTDVNDKDEVVQERSREVLAEEVSSNKTVDELEVRGEGEAENSVNRKQTTDETFETIIEASSTYTSGEAHRSVSAKSSEPSNDTKKVEKSKIQTENTPIQSSMLSILTDIEINEFEKIFKGKEVDSDVLNSTTKSEVRTKESNQASEESTESEKLFEEISAEGRELCNESSLPTKDDRLSGVEKSDEVYEDENDTANKQTIESTDSQISEIEKTLGISGESEKKDDDKEVITSNESTNNVEDSVKPCSDVMENTLERSELPAEDLRTIEIGKDVGSLEDQEHVDTKSTESSVVEDTDNTIKPDHTKGPSIELNLSSEKVTVDEKIAESTEKSNEEQNIPYQVTEEGEDLVNVGAVEHRAEDTKENPPEITLMTEQSNVTGSTIISATDSVANTEPVNTDICKLNSDEIESEKAENKGLKFIKFAKKVRNIPKKKVVSIRKTKKGGCSRKKRITRKPTNLGPEDENKGNLKISKSSCVDSLASMAKNLLEGSSNLSESSYENITDHGEHSSNTDTAVKDKETDKDVTEEPLSDSVEKCEEVDVSVDRMINAKENDNNKQLQEVAGQEDADAVKINEEFMTENNHSIQVAKVADVLEECLEPESDATSVVKETDIETLEQHKVISIPEVHIHENAELLSEICPRETIIHQTLPCSETEHLINTPIEDITSADQSVVEENNVIVSKSDENLPFSNEPVTPENEILPVDHGKSSPLQEILMHDFVASYETVNTESHSDVQENFVPEVETNFDLNKLKTVETSGTEKVDSDTYFELPSNLQDSLTVKDVNLQDKTELVHNELDHVNLDDNIPVASEVEIEYSEAYEGVPVINTEDCSIQNSLFETSEMKYENSNSGKPLHVPVKPRGRKQRAPRGRRASNFNRMTSITNGLSKEVTIEHIKSSIEPPVVPSLTTDKVPRGNSLHFLATVALNQSHCGIMLPNEEPMMLQHDQNQSSCEVMVPNEEPKVPKHEQTQSRCDTKISKKQPKASKQERKPRQRRKYNEEGVKRLTRSSSRKSSLSCDIDVKPHDFLHGATTLPKSVNVFNQYVPEPVAVSERSDESNDRLLIDDDGVLMDKEQTVSVSASVPSFDQMEDTRFEFEEKSFDNCKSNAALDYNFKPFRTKAEKKAYSTNSLYVSLEKLQTKDIFANIKHFRSRSFDINMLRPTHGKNETSKLALDVEPLEVIESPKISAKGTLSTPKNVVKKSPARRRSKPRDPLDKTSSTSKKSLTSRKLKSEKEVSTNEMVTGDEIEFNQEVEINTELPGTILRNKKVKAKTPAKGKRSKVIAGISEDHSFEKQQASTEISPTEEVPQTPVKNKKGKAKLPAKDKRIKKISSPGVNLPLTDLNAEQQLNDAKAVSNKELFDISSKKDEKIPAKVTRNRSISNSSENISLSNELNSRKQLDVTEVTPNQELLQTSQENKKGKAKLTPKGKKTKVISSSNESLPLTHNLDFEKQLNFTEMTPNKELRPTSLKNKFEKAKSPIMSRRNRAVSFCGENVPLTNELNTEKQLTSTEMTLTKESLPALTDTKKDQAKPLVKGTRRKSISRSSENVQLPNELNSEKLDTELDNTVVAENDKSLQSSQRNKTVKEKIPAKVRRNRSGSDFRESLSVNDEIHSGKQLDKKEMTQTKEPPQVFQKNKTGKAKLSTKVKRSKSVPNSGENLASSNELTSEKQLDSKESKELSQTSLKNKTDQIKSPIKVTKNKSIPDSNKNLPETKEVKAEIQLNNTETSQDIPLIQSPLKNKTKGTKLVKRNKSAPGSAENLAVNNEINFKNQLSSTEKTKSIEPPQTILKDKIDKPKSSPKAKRSKSLVLVADNELDLGKQVDVPEMTSQKKPDKTKLPVKAKQNKTIPDSDQNLSVPKELNLRDTTKLTSNKELLQVPQENKKGKAKSPVKDKRSKGISDSGLDLGFDNAKLSLNKEPPQDSLKGKKEKPKSSIKSKKDETEADSLEDLPLAILKKQFEKDVKDVYDELPLIVRMNLMPNQPEKKPKEKSPPSTNKKSPKIQENKSDVKTENKIKSPNKKTRKRDHIGDVKEENTPQPVDVKQKVEDTAANTECKRIKLNNVEAEKVQETATEKACTLPLKLRRKSTCKDTLSKFSGLSSPTEITIRNVEDVKPAQLTTGLDKKYMSPPKLRVKNLTDDERECLEQNETLPEAATTPTSLENLFKCKNTIMPTTEKLKKKLKSDLLVHDPLIDHSLQHAEVKDVSVKSLSAVLAPTLIEEKEKEIPVQNSDKMLPSVVIEKLIGEKELPFQFSDAVEISSVKKSTKKKETPLEISHEIEISSVTVEKTIKKKETSPQTSDKMLLPSVSVAKFIIEKELPFENSDEIEISPVTAKKSIEVKETPLQSFDDIQVSFVTVEKVETSLRTYDEIEVSPIAIEENETLLLISDEMEVSSVAIEKIETPLQASDEVVVSCVTVEKSTVEKETPLKTSDEIQVSSVTADKEETPIQTSDEVEVSPVTAEKEEILVQTSDEIEISCVTTEKEETPVQTPDEIEASSVTVEKSTEKEETPVQPPDEIEASSVTAEESTEKEETLQPSNQMELCEDIVEDKRIPSEDVTGIKEAQDVPLIHDVFEERCSKQPASTNMFSVQTEIEEVGASESVCITSQEVEVAKEPIDYSLSSNNASETTIQNYEDTTAETNETKSTGNANEELSGTSDYPGQVVPLLNEISASAEPEKLVQNETDSIIMENREEASSKDYPEEKSQVSEGIPSETQKDEVPTNSGSIAKKIETSISTKLMDPVPLTPILIENKVLHVKIEQTAIEQKEIPEVSTSQQQNDSVSSIEKSETKIDMDSSLPTPTTSKTPIRSPKQVKQRTKKLKIQNLKTQKTSLKNKSPTNTHQIRIKKSTFVKSSNKTSLEEMFNAVTPKAILNKFTGIKEVTVDDKKNKVSKNKQKSKVKTPITDVVKETPDTNKDDSQKSLNESTSNSLIETIDAVVNEMSDLNDPKQDLTPVPADKEETLDTIQTVDVSLKPSVASSQPLLAQLSSQKKEKKSIESIITQLKENNVSVKPSVFVENLKKKLQNKIQFTPKEPPLIVLKKGNEKFSLVNYRNKKIKHSATKSSTVIVPEHKQEMEVIHDDLSKEVSSQEPNKSVVDEPTSKIETTQPLETTRSEITDSTEQNLENKDKITEDLDPSKSIFDTQTKIDSDSSFLSIDSSHTEQESSVEVEKITVDLPDLPEVPVEKATNDSVPVDQSQHTPPDALVIHDATMSVSEPKMVLNEGEPVPDVPFSYEISESVTDSISTDQNSTMVVDTSSLTNKESTYTEEPIANIEPELLENSSKYPELKTIESTAKMISTVNEESMSIQNALPIYEETIPLNDSVDHLATSCHQSTNYLMSLAQDETTVAVASSTYQGPTPTEEFASCLDQNELTLIDNSLPHYQESTAIQGEATDYLISTAQDPNYLIPTNQNVESSLSDHQELPNINEAASSLLPTNQNQSVLIDNSFNCHINNSENNILNQCEPIPTSNLPSQHESTLELVSKASTDPISHIFTVDSIIDHAPITDVSFDDFVASTQHKEPENQLATEEFTIKEEPLSELLLTYEESISDVKSDLLSLVSGSSNRDINEDFEIPSSPPHLHVEPTTDFREITQFSTHVENERTNVLRKSKNMSLPVLGLSDMTVTTKSNEISFINPPLQSNFVKAKTHPKFTQQTTVPTSRSFSKTAKKGLSLPLLEPTIAVTSKPRDKKKSSIKASVRTSSDLFDSKLSKPSFPVQSWEPSVKSASTIETFDSESYEEIPSCVKGLDCHNVIKEIQRGQSKSMPKLETHDTEAPKSRVQVKGENKELEVGSPASKVSPIKRVVRFNLPENSPITLPNEKLKRKNPFTSIRTLDAADMRPVPGLIKTSNVKVKNETETKNLDKPRVSTAVSPKKGLDLPKLETSDFSEGIYDKSPKKSRSLDMPILETAPPGPIVSKRFRRSSTDVPTVQDSTTPRGITTRTRKKSLDLPIIQPLDVPPENKIVDKPSPRKSAAPGDVLSRALVGIAFNADKMSSVTGPSTSKVAEATSPNDFLLNLPPKYSITSSDGFRQATSAEQNEVDKIVSSAPVQMEGGLVEENVPVSKPMEYEEFKKWITGVVPEPLIKLQDENFENCLVSEMSTEAKCIPEVHSEVEVYCEKPGSESKSPYFSPMGEVSTEFLNNPSRQDLNDPSMSQGDEAQIPFTLPEDDIDAPEYTGEVIIEHDMRDELIGEIIQSPSFINDSEEGSRSATEAPMMPQVLSCLDSDASKPGPSGCQAAGKQRRASGSDLLNFQDISPTKFSQALELMSPKISYSNSNFGGESSNVMLSSKMIDDTQTFSGCTPRTEIRCCLDDTTDHTYHHLGGPLLSMFSHNFNTDPLEQPSDNFNSHLPDLSKAPSGEIGESQNTSEPYLVNFSLSDFENINLIDLSTSENKSDRKKIDITNVPLMEEMELPDKTWQQFNAHNPKVVVVINERCSTPTYSMSEDIFGNESNSEQSQSADSQSPIRVEVPKEPETKAAAKGKSIPRAKDVLGPEVKGRSVGEAASKTVPPQPNCQIKVKQNLFPENKPSSLTEKSGSSSETKQKETVTTTPDKPSQEAASTNPLKAKKKGPLIESEVSAKRLKLSKKKASDPETVSNIFDAVKSRQRKSTNRYTSEQSKKPFDKMGSFLDSPARISDTSKFLDEFNQKVSSEKDTLKKTTTKSTPASPQQEPQNKEQNSKGLTKRVSPLSSQQDSLTDNLLNYGLKTRFNLKESQSSRVEPAETSSQETRETAEPSRPVEAPRPSSSTAKPETFKKTSNVNASHAEDFKVKESDYYRRVKMAGRETPSSPSLTDNLLNHNLLRRELSRPSYKSRPPEPPPPGHFLNYTSRPSTSGTSSKSVYDSRSKEKYPPWYENHYKPKYAPDPDREASEGNKIWSYNQDPNRRTYSKNMLANDFGYRDYNRPPPDPSKRSANGVHNHSIDHILNRDSNMKYKQYKSEEISKRSSSGSEEDRMRKMRKGESEFDSLYKTGNQNPNFMLKVTKSNRLKLVKQRNRFHEESKGHPEYYKEHDFGRVSPRELRESSGSSHRSYPSGSFMDREKKFRGKADYSGSFLEMPRSMSSDRMRGNSSISDFRDMRPSKESLESMEKKNERRYKDSSVMGEAPHGSLSPERSKGSSTSMDRAMKDAREKAQDEKNKPGRQKEWFEIFNEKFKEYDYGSSAPKFW